MEEIQGPSSTVRPNLVEPAQQSYFYERPDGSIISVSAKEAWAVHRKNKFKQIGVSDGRKFHQAVQEAHAIFKETGDLVRAQECIRQGEKDEIEIARGKFMTPPNFDTVDKYGRPVNIRDIT